MKAVHDLPFLEDAELHDGTENCDCQPTIDFDEDPLGNVVMVVEHRQVRF